MDLFCSKMDLFCSKLIYFAVCQAGSPFVESENVGANVEFEIASENA